ncbi:DUF6607 family protein [Caulobacter sp. NIBR1757]|uniref:DUF6607 family protein n=1 Tax=Caulobacter sp. NIBR1757 TaxID=3016000 RepID=UPI0022F09D95|nr:DUF6607 family protein [Caulobacter sp. NIBR1757]WGM37598.1 hypothetical protein AMEJIAPC_00497 [Caulobacter sp. NIBR1757]
MLKTTLAALTAVLALSVAAPSLAAPKPAPAPVSAEARARFEQDRASILAMAGDYRVTFDFRETVAFVPGYQPIDPKRSGGFESVRVIEDTGTRIVLQHLLVVTMPESEDSDKDKTVVIKHWRQDWIYEPTSVLTYDGSGRWVLADVAADKRQGAWSQTVWQTDDSPRYGGVGRWAYDDGVSRWMSEPTRRPLARRDAVRKPVYGWYVGTNRHALTPNGWVHEQDNAKVGLKDGVPVTYVHEVVLNTYRKENAYNIKAADDYWSATQDYWAQVRADWDLAILKGRGVTVAEEPENGSVTGPRLMGLADEVVEGKIDPAAAKVEAARVIMEKVGPAVAAK